MTDETQSVPSAPEQATVLASEKQIAAVTKIAEGIAARNLGDGAPEFSQEKVGGDLFLRATNWPTIKVGKGGGVTVLDLRSYPEGDGKTAIDAAINGDVLLAKQIDRDAKKAAQPAVPAAPDAAPTTPAESETAFETAATDEEPIFSDSASHSDSEAA